MHRFVLCLCLFGTMAPENLLAKRRRPPPPEEALGGRLRWGKCLPSTDPRHSSLFPAACINAKFATQLMLREDVGDRNIAQNYGRVYSGLHFHRFLSVHGTWIRKRLFRISQQNSQKDDTRPQDVFLQVGNPAVNKFRLSAGKMHLPFGIDDRPLVEIMDELKPTNYWRSPKWGAKLHYDTLVSSQYEIGYATTKLPEEGGIKEKSTDNQSDVIDNEALSLRSMFDVTATDSFRFVVSGYGDRLGQRRLGFGFVTMTHKGDGTIFEWVRLRHTPDGKGPEEYDQIFRLTHTGRFQSGTRWLGEYEDQRLDYRRLVLGHDFFLPDYGLFRLSAAFTREVRPERHDYFLIITGMELSL